MSFAVLHRDDARPTLAPLPGLVVERANCATLMADIQRKPVEEITARFNGGHVAYVAWLDGEPVAWGWVATRSARIGEVGATFTIPAGERYLWNFVTIPSHRGRGIYPRLLDAIIRIESMVAERFWIAYAPENHASGAGVAKAGFQSVAQLSFDREGIPAVRSLAGDGGTVLSRALGIRETDDRLAPCWRCVRAGRIGMYCAEGTCACDYQRADGGCAA